MNHLAKKYPLHFQRIVEETYRQRRTEAYVERALKDKLNDIHCLFVWSETKEGPEYWLRLYDCGRKHG